MGVVSEEKIVIVGGRLFDGTGAPARLATVVLEGKTITKILEMDDISYPQGAEIIDATGKTVMPGLIDLHVHTTYVKQFPPSELSTKSQADAALRGVERLRYFLESGITSVRDVASHGFAPFILNSYFRENILPGPRIFAAGQLITSRGGHGADRLAYHGLRSVRGRGDGQWIVAGSGPRLRGRRLGSA